MAAVFGCGGDSQDSPGPAKNPTVVAGAVVNVLVAGDPTLAEALRRLRGEWKAKAGGEFEVLEASAQGLADAPLAADAVLYPSGLLGELAERQRLAPLPEDQPGASRSLQPGLFDLLMLEESRWGQRRMALSFGSPQLIVYYRADLFRKFEKRPPTTWAEYAELAAFFGDRGNLSGEAPPADRPWSGALEPWGEGWAGLTLLARAAPYAKHPDLYSGLFDIDQMIPLIAGPGFTQALDELNAAGRFGPEKVEALTPEACRSAFWRGECALALTWPTAAGAAPSVAAGVEAGICELPGATRVFDPRHNRWQELGRRVPLLAVEGRLGSLTATCPIDRRGAALALLQFLAAPENASHLAAGSQGITLYLDAHLQRPELWVEKPLASQAAVYAQLVRDRLRLPEYLMAPRLPGRARHLAELDEAVRQTLSGEQTSAIALRMATQRIMGVVVDHGRPSQVQAYRRDLGIVP